MKKFILIVGLIVLFSNTATYIWSAVDAHEDAVQASILAEAKAEEEFYRGAAILCAQAYTGFIGAPPDDAWKYCRDSVFAIVDMDIYGTHPAPGWVWPPFRPEGE